MPLIATIILGDVAVAVEFKTAQILNLNPLDDIIIAADVACAARVGFPPM